MIRKEPNFAAWPGYRVARPKRETRHPHDGTEAVGGRMRGRTDRRVCAVRLRRDGFAVRAGTRRRSGRFRRLIVDAQMRGRRACHRDWRRYGPNRMVRFVGPRCVREVRRTYRTRPRDRRNCVQVGPLWLCE
jgi:hypothetical protein